MCLVCLSTCWAHTITSRFNNDIFKILSCASSAHDLDSCGQQARVGDCHALPRTLQALSASKKSNKRKESETPATAVKTLPRFDFDFQGDSKHEITLKTIRATGLIGETRLVSLCLVATKLYNATRCLRCRRLGSGAAAARTGRTCAAMCVGIRVQA